LSLQQDCQEKYDFEQKYDFEESIGYWLTIATQGLHRQFNDELAPHGVTFRQSQVLGWLALEGELSQAELASRMMIEPPTLAGILDRMERTAWITRESCAGDRRRKLIRIRPQAEPVWAKIADCARRVRARATRGLSEEEIETLKRLLRVVHENMDRGERIGNAEQADTPL
jgi:MarR family transcriptional regulator for hemolysin